MNRWMRGGAALALGVTLGCNLDQQSGSSNMWQERNRAAIDNAEVEPEPEIRPVTHFAAGQLFERRGRLQDAVVQYRKAIDLNPRFVTAYNRLGVCLDRLGRFDDANRSFQQAIGIEPQAAYLRNNLGFSLMMQRRWAEAAATLQQAIAIKPDFTRARVNLGIALAHQGHYADGWSHFEQAVGGARAHYNLGLVYEVQGRGADAITCFRRAVDLDSGLRQARYHLDKLEEALHPSDTALATLAPAPPIADPPARIVQTVAAPAPGAPSSGSAEAFSPQAVEVTTRFCPPADLTGALLAGFDTGPGDDRIDPVVDRYIAERATAHPQPLSPDAFSLAECSAEPVIPATPVQAMQDFMQRLVSCQVPGFSGLLCR